MRIRACRVSHPRRQNETYILANVWLGSITTQVHEACLTRQLYSLSILGNTTA